MGFEVVFRAGGQGGGAAAHRVEILRGRVQACDRDGMIGCKGDAAGLLAANVMSMHVGAFEWGHIHHMAPELSCTWFDLLKTKFDILPVKSRFTVQGRKVHRNVSVEPSAGFVISPGGLDRFMQELETGKWDWTAGWGEYVDTSEGT